MFCLIDCDHFFFSSHLSLIQPLRMSLSSRYGFFLPCVLCSVMFICVPNIMQYVIILWIHSTTAFMAFLGESINHCINILNQLAQKIGKKKHANKANVLNQKAQRHSNHRSVSQETDEYKLSLKKSDFCPQKGNDQKEHGVFLLIVCTTERIKFRLSRGLSFSLPF